MNDQTLRIMLGTFIDRLGRDAKAIETRAAREPQFLGAHDTLLQMQRELREILAGHPVSAVPIPTLWWVTVEGFIGVPPRTESALDRFSTTIEVAAARVVKHLADRGVTLAAAREALLRVAESGQQYSFRGLTEAQAHALHDALLTVGVQVRMVTP